MTEVSRIPVPSTSGTPKVRQKMPDPFRRPSITIGGVDPTDKREWRTIPVTDVQVGDMLPGIGLVHDVQEYLRIPEGEWEVVVVGGVGNRKTYRGHESVLVFTKVAKG